MLFTGLNCAQVTTRITLIKKWLRDSVKPVTQAQEEENRGQNERRARTNKETPQQETKKKKLYVTIVIVRKNS